MNTPLHAIAPAHLPLDRVVAYWAERRGNESALELETDSEPHRISWLEFEKSIQGMANALADQVGVGANVAVVCADSVSFHVLLNALWRRGASVLLVNRTWGIEVVNDLLRLTCATLVFAPDEIWGEGRHVGAPVRRFPVPRGSTSPSEGSVFDVDRIAIYATTSGTTDDPKCVSISHRQIRSAYRACFSEHDFSHVKRAASLFPLNGIGVMGVCFLLPREVGAGTHIFPPFSLANIERTWSSVLEKVDFVYVVPPLVRLLNALRARGSRQERLLTFCAAAPVREEELRKLEQKFPVSIYNAYGLTELTFAVFFGCREADAQASESIGWARGVEAKIVGDDGVVVEGAGRGELLLRGPMLTDGYLGNPTATDLVWLNGWLRTGDIAERDRAGRYFIRGRAKDAIIRGGVLTYLHELEHYLRRAPDVVDACAFKGRDLASGDELCVVVQAQRAVSPAELLDWARKHVGEDKVPNVLFVWTEALPRNSNGKVLRSALAEMYREGTLG